MTAVEAINKFVDVMLKSREKFSQVKAEVEAHSSGLKKCGESFRKNIKDLIEAVTSRNVSVKDKEISAIQSKQIGELDIVLQKVSESINKTLDGMEFIRKHEQSFNIAVFGKVKAGKSYTGNFIMGNVIRDMHIQTSYDKTERPKVKVIDRGKERTQSKLVEFDEEGKEGFRVDPNEATSTIQLFTLGGMQWIDTPGIGSVTDANGLLAKDFVDNADLIVYMANSKVAGTTQDFTELTKLHEKRSRFLLLLTRSDTIDFGFDDDGEEIDVIVPESEEKRREMEDYICDSLQKLGIKEIERGKELLTVSTKLALESLKNNDSAMWDASNLEKFLAILREITENESAKLKLSTPGKRINAAIKEITKILEEAKKKLREYSDILREKEERLTDNNETLLAKMKNDSYKKIEEFITRKAEEVEKGGASVSASDIEREINSVVYNFVMNACAKEFSGSERILSSYSESLKIHAGGDLSMKTDTISHTERVVERERRDPTGLWENIGSFFGKEYYSTTTRNITITSKIDLGVNTAQVMASIRSGLDKIFAAQIPEIMKKIVAEILSPIRDVQEKANAEIDKTKKELESLKFADTHTEG